MQPLRGITFERTFRCVETNFNDQLLIETRLKRYPHEPCRTPELCLTSKHCEEMFRNICKRSADRGERVSEKIRDFYWSYSSGSISDVAFVILHGYWVGSRLLPWSSAASPRCWHRRILVRANCKERGHHGPSRHSRGAAAERRRCCCTSAQNKESRRNRSMK